MRTQITLLLEKYIELVEDSQKKSDHVPEELKQFAKSIGHVIKSPRHTRMTHQHKEAVVEMLFSIALATNKTIKNKEKYIENILIACLYFLEIDYDSPLLRKKEMEAIDASHDNRIKGRKQWMKIRRKFIHEHGYKEDRRDLHGILILQKLLEHGLKERHNHKFESFLDDNLRLEQNKGQVRLKLHPRLIIAHLMYFWIPNESRSEESIRKIISGYWNNKKKRQKIYLPSHYPLIYSEMELWDKIHQIEKGHTLSSINIDDIPLEWLIVHFWRGSLVNTIKNLDKDLLTVFICKKFKIPHVADSESILSWFQNNIDMRCS